jgi:TetR/AcrR family transcriptional regulator
MVTRRALASQRTRDPGRTRQRILEAALQEFSARGFAGARVDRIARRARANKRMLYHYFRDKDGLFRAILRLKLAERSVWLARDPGDPERSLPYWFGRIASDVDWVRLMQWEALEVGGGAVIGEEERRAAVARSIDWVRARQAEGTLPRALDPRQLLLALASLTTFPIAFPQFTRLCTGHPPGAPAFHRKRVEFLRRFARVLAGDGARRRAAELHA